MLGTQGTGFGSRTDPLPHSGGNSEATKAIVFSSVSDGCPRSGSVSATTRSEPSGRDLSLWYYPSAPALGVLEECLP